MVASVFVFAAFALEFFPQESVLKLEKPNHAAQNIRVRNGRELLHVGKIS